MTDEAKHLCIVIRTDGDRERMNKAAELLLEADYEFVAIEHIGESYHDVMQNVFINLINEIRDLSERIDSTTH